MTPIVEHSLTDEMKLRAARRKKWQAQRGRKPAQARYLKINGVAVIHEGPNRQQRRHGTGHLHDIGTLELGREQRRARRQSVPGHVFRLRGRMR